ncbi:hypothetical protein AVEN_95530-1 [Araneus ventricosus]|uniref:Uncharacterized protein n=1 Tax=Araneus ventricosus TaxID=182803 RepID=A0A4Y2HEL4_ARAVE|nr:hypothetical protein AVEN_95530-1 [Araneus ventricosus]
MWAPRNVDELLRFHMKELARLGLHKWGRSPPPVIVRTSYGRGWAVRLCWPLGPDLSTRFYCNGHHSVFSRMPRQVGVNVDLSLPSYDVRFIHREADLSSL